MIVIQVPILDFNDMRTATGFKYDHVGPVSVEVGIEVHLVGVVERVE